MSVHPYPRSLALMAAGTAFQKQAQDGFLAGPGGEPVESACDWVQQPEGPPVTSS